MKMLIRFVARYLQKRKIALELRFALAAIYGMLELYGYIGTTSMIVQSLRTVSDETVTQLMETLNNGRN